MNERSIFIAALEIDNPSDRAVYLDKACADDADLRKRIDGLLHAHARAGGVLDRPGEEASTEDHRPSPESVGALIGPYKLLQKLGEGGMGFVYLAEQEKPVRRKVALKIIKPGMDTGQVIARFESERQALALMDHPNIAKVLDAGATDSGRPYFVMELVKGISITKYCDQENLTLRDRLGLFVPICQAVQHAHQKGIIHRDLKPSNVLIALYDGSPVPKVIDFGVSKATNQKLTERTMFTEVGSIVGTLEYMAPEQAELNNLDIDTRADIYSLGVLLYEILAGSPPFTSEQLRSAGLGEMLRMIKEVEPPKPSTRLSTSEELPTIAAKRKLEPKRLKKQVSGELDWIVMKCLEKERGRRYETANGLALDIQHYLADEPVQACPPSTAYRLRKLLRRHKGPVIAVVLILGAMVAGTAVATWQAVRATRAEVATTQERDRAKQAEQGARLLQAQAQQESEKAVKSAAEANAMITFFKELALESRRSKKEGEKWRAKTVDESLDVIIDSEKIRELFVNHPLAEAEICEWLANSAISIGGFTIDFQTQPLVPGTPPQKRGTVLTHLFPGGSVTLPFDPVANRRNLERALELRRIHLGPNDPQTLATMFKLGIVYISQGLESQSIELLGQLVVRSSETLGPDNEITLEYMDKFATAYEEAQKPIDAVLVWKDVYTRSAVKWGSDSNNALDRSDGLAAAYEKAGRFEDALRQREESLRGRRNQTSGSFDLKVGLALKEVARLYHLRREYTRAESLWREALQFVNQDRDVQLLADLQQSFGECLLQTGKPSEAEHVLRQRLAFLEKKSPKEWITSYAKSQLSESLFDQKKYAEAELLLVQAYEGMKGTYDNTHLGDNRKRDMTEALERLVKLYEATGKKDEAVKWRKELEANQKSKRGLGVEEKAEPVKP